MKYESIKTVILAVLVFLSVFLTWNLWTYQPNYATMEKSNTIAEVTLSEKQEVQKIIQPNIVLFHEKGMHYGTVNSGKLDKLVEEMSRWSFNDVNIYSVKAGNLNQLEHGNGKVEIIFPAEVPVELYRNVLTFAEKKIPSFTFDRIVINIYTSNKNNGTVYFISTANQAVYSSHVSVADINNLYRNFYMNAVDYPSYFAYNPTQQRTIFLPENSIQMTEYKYLPVTLNSDVFKEALFTDPSFVQKTDVSSGEEYTNGLSKMDINNDKNLLFYVNPTAEGNYSENPNDLLKRSIDFVNEHGGWTDDYRYANMDDFHHEVTFRLYSDDGYPVFNVDGTSEIHEDWGPDDINNYVRPNISLELPLKTEMQTVTLSSGYDALKSIQNLENIKPGMLENLVLGYEMERDTIESKLIILKPMWFYEYNKKWYSLSMEVQGGINNGLE